MMIIIVVIFIIINATTIIINQQPGLITILLIVIIIITILISLAEFGSGAVSHPDPEVRAAGQELVILLYRYLTIITIILSSPS